MIISDPLVVMWSTSHSLLLMLRDHSSKVRTVAVSKFLDKSNLESHETHTLGGLGLV
jgi:hypothetical protein